MALRVAVTGATGFIGRNLCQHLADRGHDVVAVVRSEGARPALEAMGLELALADVADAGALNSAFAGADAVVHLAAYFNRPDASPEDYTRVNVDGAVSVARAAQAAGARMIHASTIGVAVGPGAPPYSEKTPYHYPEADNYERTKALGEQAVLDFQKESGAEVIVIRPAQVYGPGDTSKVKFYKLIRGGVIVRPGETLRHMVHVDDLCRAFEAALTTEHCQGDVFIIADDEPVRLDALVQMAASALDVRPPRVRLPALPVHLLASAVELGSNAVGIKPPFHRRSMDFFTRSVAFDTTRARTLLGFKPQVELESGIRQTIAWYRSEGML